MWKAPPVNAGIFATQKPDFLSGPMHSTMTSPNSFLLLQIPNLALEISKLLATLVKVYSNAQNVA